MEVKNVKLSNYVGQIKDKDEQSINDHMVNIDKDLQNLWIIINAISPLVGSSRLSLSSNTNIGFSYLPQINSTPTTIPQARFGKSAICFCNSNSNLYIYNTSDTSWKTVHLT